MIIFRDNRENPGLFSKDILIFSSNQPRTPRVWGLVTGLCQALVETCPKDREDGNAGLVFGLRPGPIRRAQGR